MATAIKRKKQEKKDKEEIARLATLTEDQLRDYYKELKNGVWETTWEVLNSDGWKACSGKDLETGIVYSKQFKEYGLIFKLEGYLELGVDDAFHLLVMELEQAPQWNNTISHAQVLLTLDENSDIAWNATSEAMGGLIGARDFVNLRHWSSRGDTTLSSGRSILHPGKPVSKSFIRGENRHGGGWAFRKVPESPNRCIFIWLMNTDLKGWLPKGLLDTAFPKAQLDYLENVRKHILTLKGDLTNSVPPT